jgi:hypothetical protein
MLTIRSEQLKCLQESREHDWLVSYLSACYPQQTSEIGARRLSEFVEGAVKDALRAGAESANAKLKYVHLSFVLGPRFHEGNTREWIRAIWRNPRLTTVFERLEETERALPEHLEGGRDAASRAGSI